MSPPGNRAGWAVRVYIFRLEARYLCTYSNAYIGKLVLVRKKKRHTSLGRGVLFSAAREACRKKLDLQAPHQEKPENAQSRCLCERVAPQRRPREEAAAKGRFTLTEGSLSYTAYSK